MRNLFVLVALAITAASCGKLLGDNEFLVKGVIKNSKNQTVYLSEYTNTGTITVDSVKISEDGEFKLKGKTSYPKFYMLRISPNDYISLIIDSADVLTVTADAKDFAKSSVVEGSDEMTLFKKVNDRMALTINAIDSLGNIYRSAVDSLQQDSLKQILDKDFEKIKNSQVEFSKKFIDENPGSMTSLIALSQQIVPQVTVFVLPDDLKYFEKVNAELTKKYPGSEDVKRLNSFLANMKNESNETNQDGEISIGTIAPDIELENPAGKKIALSSLRGKYVLLDFWAGWCKPCRMENPNLVENYKKYNGQGFDIYQVSLDKEKSLWLKAIEQDQLGKWSHVSDLKFWQSEPAQLYGIASIPANFLLDKEGKIIAMNLRGEELGNKLKEIFKN
ncbi:MAG: TlpA disulfide reductase family protein [Bacteroidales bacterium]